MGGDDGETTLDFFQWTKEEKTAFSYIWEPDIVNRKKCNEMLCDINERIEIVNKGLWDKKEKLRFSHDERESSRIDNNGELCIEVDRLDDVVKDEVTFIKMDIEGAEIRALMGAKETIVRNKPKLAICVYHKPEDIVEIPKLILSFRDDYIFGFWHYSYADNETVLFAY